MSNEFGRIENCLAKARQLSVLPTSLDISRKKYRLDNYYFPQTR